eukprot:3463842-Rhodomonas_salina.1
MYALFDAHVSAGCDGARGDRRRNSGAVRYVLSQLVRFGAPEGILVQGKPHLGTDRLVRILKSLRTYLEEHGAFCCIA